MGKIPPQFRAFTKNKTNPDFVFVSLDYIKKMIFL